MKKKILSLLLALVMALSLVPVTAFAADGDEQPNYPVFSKLVFAGDPAFNAERTYYGKPEGTLFQLDENGERTEKVGLADDCLRYAVYVTSTIRSVKLAGRKALDYLKNSFVYAPEGFTVSVSSVVDGVKTEIIAPCPTRMSACMKWASAAITLGAGETEMLIEFADKTSGKVVRTYSVTFVKMAMTAEMLIAQLEKLEPEKLVWPDDNGYVGGLVQGYNGLSEADKVKIPNALKEKLNRADEIVGNGRVPETLEITTPPNKLHYTSEQSFDATGMVVVATYADGRTRTLNDAKYYTVTPAGTLGNVSEVTISYNGRTVTQKIQLVNYDLKGDGTEENPYLLSSAADLQMLHDAVAAGQSTEGKHFKMTADITLPDNWQPIGCTKDGTNNIDKGANLNAFSGILDGNNKLLTVPKGGLPLLGYIKGATVKNLNIYGEQIDGYGLVNNFEGVGLSGSAIVIDNVTLKSGSKTLKSGLIGANITTNGFAGCSAGFVATIRNCTIEKGVVVGYTGTESFIGSIAGRLQGTVENCVSYATVKGVNQVGGIIGARDNAVGDCKVIGCSFGGEVIGSGLNAGGIMGAMYIGGGAPNASRVVTQGCTVTGTVTGKENVGGIIGADSVTYQNWGSYPITGNTFSGKISGETNVGGLIGFYRSLNGKDDIAGNAYTVACGADKAFGRVEYVDTNYANPTVVDGTTYVNSENGKTGIGGMTKTGLNRTDDPLGKDAANLAIAVEDATDPVCYKLNVSGECKTQYTLGESFDLSGLVFTAYWTMGKEQTNPTADEITVTGFDSSKRGEQTVTLAYGAAKVQLTVTVLKPAGDDITVTFSLLGDTVHGDEGEKHTLVDGNLAKWIDGAQITIDNNATALDVIVKALGDQYTIENPSGNYITSITPKDGAALGEFTNGSLSGWMFTLNGVYGDLGVAQQYLNDGDVIVFHYTDDYAKEYEADNNKKKTAEEVAALIDAIGTVDLSKGAAISKARTAYDKLSADEKALVTNYDKLLAAEAAYAKLVAEMGKKLDEIYKTTGDFMGTLGTPTVNSTGGEWMVIGLARSGRTVPAGYYDNVVKFVRENADKNERLDRNKVTDNARVILALTAIGKDVTNVGGHNLLKGLDNMAYVQTQGINGPIFTLIALDSHNYPTMGDVTREKLIQVILDAQLPDGGWNLSGENADPDMTAMAIQALAPYYKTNETVKAAVDKALDVLSGLQQGDGGFGSWGTINSESCAQVIVALTALGIDPTADSRFVKNDLTVLDALASFYVTGGGFKHVADKGRDGMATEQGYYALAAYYRFVNAQTRLYDMTDVTVQTGGSNTPATGDTGVLVWVVALPVTALAAAFVLKRKEQEV